MNYLTFNRSDCAKLAFYQLILLLYRYAIVWKKGYQETDLVVSATTTKLKGTVYTNYSELGESDLNHRIWDVADYVIPPEVIIHFSLMCNDCISTCLYPVPVFYC